MSHPGSLAAPTICFRLRLQRFQLTMDFLGYTHVTPVKRQWETLRQSFGELRYTTPGLGSANMEPIAFYLQYLKALPTLRITGPQQGVVQFETKRGNRPLTLSLSATPPASDYALPASCRNTYCKIPPCW